MSGVLHACSGGDGGDGEYRFWLSSRGDLVRGRVRSSKGGPGQPLVVVAAPGGGADHPWVDALFAAWSEWAALVALDLPLCGSRRSDKLSEYGLDPGHAIAAQIRGDLESQLAADLAAVVELVRGRDRPRPACVSLVASGPTAQWAEAAARKAGGFDPVLVSAESDPDEAWLLDAATRIRP
ncbi:MAG: hypothetical protein JRG76_02775 [Deltaproteobacteria bacterium]|nr:hypothetical protein [Deltaproteobacteria bacterium]MBW2413413.1 hypothetical protein [Deltaproteobacteria bacterium]